MTSDCIISNLSVKVRFETGHLCQCTVFLKAMRSFVLYVSSSFPEYSVGPEGSGGNSVLVASICKFVDVLIVNLIIQT